MPTQLRLYSLPQGSRTELVCIGAWHCRDFGETAPELLSAYSVPHPFRWDLFSWAGYARDEYRWLVRRSTYWAGQDWHAN